jgi:hypothetical protein
MTPAERALLLFIAQSLFAGKNFSNSQELWHLIVGLQGEMAKAEADK